MGKTKAEKQLDIEWEQRVLCSDESCIGVIGPDGNCKECGLKYQGELPDFSASHSDDTSDEQEVAHRDGAEDMAAADKAEIEDDEWEQRTLCSDESCIGVIGPDGNCKECGRAYEP